MEVPATKKGGIAIPRREWIALVCACVLVALTVGFVLHGRKDTSSAAVAAKQITAHRRVVPPAEIPQIEPVAFISGLSMDQARAINLKIPFVKDGVVPARPFAFTGGTADKERAVTCLAVALLYEAGDDATGERAVAQVILNRVRHPAFPKSICGVVFQGSERVTGCQFTFTCDGALVRIPNPVALARARTIATRAIEGSVDKSVGHATHYHTDWVVPYWSSSLDKIAKVGTHLFFRWTGWWGTQPAFRGQYTGIEPIQPKIAAFSAAHRTEEVPETAVEVAAVTDAPVAADAGPAPVDESALHFTPAATNADVFLVSIPKGLSAQRYAAVAERACGSRSRCVFMAWTDPSLMPSGLPATTSQLQSMAFHYLRDPALPAPRMRWNCSMSPRDDKSQCLSHQG